MILLPGCKCCCRCADDCTGTIEYVIEVLGGIGVGPTSFGIDEQPHTFSGSGTNGKYLDGTISVTCDECLWTVTVEACYGDNDTPNTTETWQATVRSGSDGCPPAGELDIQPLDPPSNLAMTLTVS